MRNFLSQIQVWPLFQSPSRRSANSSSATRMLRQTDWRKSSLKTRRTWERGAASKERRQLVGVHHQRTSGRQQQGQDKPGQPQHKLVIHGRFFIDVHSVLSHLLQPRPTPGFWKSGTVLEQPRQMTIDFARNGQISTLLECYVTICIRSILITDFFNTIICSYYKLISFCWFSFIIKFFFVRFHHLML